MFFQDFRKTYFKQYVFNTNSTIHLWKSIFKKSQERPKKVSFVNICSDFFTVAKTKYGLSEILELQVKF